MLNAVIKTPRLCDQFQKAMIKKKEEEMKKSMDTKMDCFHYLTQEISKFPNEKAFLKDLTYKIERVHMANSV